MLGHPDKGADGCVTSSVGYREHARMPGLGHLIYLKLGQLLAELFQLFGRNVLVTRPERAHPGLNK